jgi:hypothetical protein
MNMSGHFHAPATLPLEKERQVPTGYEAGWTPELIINVIYFAFSRIPLLLMEPP